MSKPSPALVAREKVLCWFAIMVNASRHLTPEDDEALAAWETEFVGSDKGYATSDWPGWARYIDLDCFWPWDHPQRQLGEPRPPKPITPPSRGYYLYRLWGTDDRLLYVGVSTRLRSRLTSHRRRIGHLITRVTWEECTDAESMLAAETVAIREEDPALNKAKVG